MTVHHTELFRDLGVSLDHKQGHILCAGNSGSGKTALECLIARHKLRNPLTGFILIDPEGQVANYCVELLANPESGLAWRKVHYVRPASPTTACALPVLHVPDRSAQLCHDKAVRALTIFEQAVAFGAPDYGPRLSKYFYLGCLGLALSGRSLVDLPDLYSNAPQLRQLIANAYPYEFLRDAMLAVDFLSDRAALEYKDPLISRLMPIFGNERLRRVFGPQPPLDIAAVLRNREVVLLDLSGMESKDAVLVGKAFANLVYHEALQREPDVAPHCHLMWDEAFDYLTADIAKGFDRLRKRNIQLCIAIQRDVGQLGRIASDDDTAAVLSAVISGTNTKIVFRLPEPDDADLMTNVLFRGHVELQEWKQGSARPTAVGNAKEILRNWSRAEHEAQHESYALTQSHSHGEAVGTSTSMSIGTGEFSASGDAQNLTMQATVQLFGPNAPGAQMLPVPLTQSNADSSSSGTSEQRASSTASSHVAMEVHGEAVTQGRGTSRGTSISEGASETYVTQYEQLPTQMYSLQEQQHRLAGEIQNLALRECFVKIHHQRPVRTRTRDLEPAFKSAYCRRVMLPLFNKKVVARSGYLFPVADVDAQIAARLAVLKPAPKLEPDFTKPEPVPASIVDAPQQFATDFWRKRKPPGSADQPPKKPTKPKGRLPSGDDRHGRFRVFPGGKDNGDNPK